MKTARQKQAQNGRYRAKFKKRLLHNLRMKHKEEEE